MKSLGQYFTTHSVLLNAVKKFVLNDRGVVLEPSCGAGHIVDHLLKNGDKRAFECIEIDDGIEQLETLKNTDSVRIHSADFLEYQTDKKFSTIVGNPPYVKRKGKRNLYIDFIAKCIDLLEDDGELVFVIPSDFFKLTSASSVKNQMMEEGTITHVFHPHDEKFFKNASQDVIVLRYQKGLFTRTTHYNEETRTLSCHNGNMFFENGDETTEHLSDLFHIKVGMVSGADKIYKNDDLGNLKVKSYSGTHTYIYHDELPTQPPSLVEYLNQHKDALIKRGIRKFTETDWFKWGCPRNVGFMKDHEGEECIYCATITRKKQVFFKGKVCLFDGSLLCLLPKKQLDIDKVLAYLNSETFLESFLYSGRYKMGQKSLLDASIPVILS